ncbi:MAG TPA: carboxypeptidase regulatory-like domain-containing protein, partial [Flavisolibacter sp.]|nr:carboxypeptidase regulatory-like domain-containing protein [Flavisolibacter sp.]
MTLCHILRKFIAIAFIIFMDRMKYLLLFLLSLCFITAATQTDSSGILHGNILDEKKKALEGASVTLVSLKDSNFRKFIMTDPDGEFTFENIRFGYYRLVFSHVNTAPLKIDSIHFRAERSDFNLSDIVLKSKSNENLEEVIVYAEKPLVQSKDGNITFNAGESALSAGSNASDLLGNVPLVTKDQDGKILVRGKEPKILIDDKPVELNQQQLQDLLESLPGSYIEKVEVMTNPPPQFANEPGGVINITTKKRKVGKSGRLNLSAGSRGEASLNGNYNYRKKGLSFSVNAGAGFNQFRSEGYDVRENFNNAGIKSFRTESQSKNQNIRPNFRVNLDYEINKQHALNLTTQLNANSFDNRSQTLFLPSYQMSDRRIFSTGENLNAQLSLTYTYKTKRPGEVLRWFTNINLSSNENDREFNQEFLNTDYSFNGIDSLQQQFFDNKTNSFNNRISYDVPLKNKKTFLSLGGFWNLSRSSIQNDAMYRRYTDRKLMPLTPLINTFYFHQDIINVRGSFRHAWSRYFSITAGS